MGELMHSILVSLGFYAGGLVLGGLGTLWMQEGPAIYMTMIITGLRNCF
jgi:hypothetical protein